MFIPKGIDINYQSGSNGSNVLVLSPADLENYLKEVAEILDAGPITLKSKKQIARRSAQEFLENLKHWGR